MTRDPFNSPHEGRTGWLIVLAVGTAAAMVGYLVSVGLGCSTSCSVGRSPLSLALLVGVIAAVAAATGIRR